MGFGETFIDMVWRIMSNNWYCVIINGSRHGFFHSIRGLKQGDPLSPALFVLGAEVLTRILNNLHQHYLYTGFQMENRGPQINHLSFADDIIIFTSTSKYSLQLIMKTLQMYEGISGQFINKDKSQILIPTNTPDDIIDRVVSITGYKCTHGPMTYLGCPLYIGRQRVIYFTSIVAKVIAKIQGWQTKMLSYGGRATLIKSGWDKEKRKYHWASWETLSLPYEEGGNCSFWWDDWLGIGSLANHYEYIPRFNNSTVSMFLTNGKWNEEKIRKQAPQHMIHTILNTEIMYQQNTLDQAQWKLQSHGNFTCKSAWENVRKKKNKTLTDRMTWHTNIPFKASFLLWKALRHKLPTNDKLISFGRETAECSCCYRPGLDNINHSFVSGSFAKHI
ncbi:uncharacterized protein LOC129890016 [Solanum dulcamara]|uniref:uncharacterized protein LOC129890016 n=1 Tax=Solanum dulcamara TaxID=45834 RepID=UPI0024854CBC|nr:uncharacterized protein LOC129890016 [Solanum dulcamara]